MTLYDDGAVVLDESGITIRNYQLPGSPRHIPYADIEGASLIRLRFGTGRHRLVGYSPGRPRHFFHWDRSRGTKSHGVALVIGRRRRLGVTPDDPEGVLEIIRNRIAHE